MRAKRLRVLVEAWIVGGDVAGDAAVHARIAELRNDGLLDAGLPLVESRPLALVLGQRARLIEIRGLVPLPAVKELIVKDDAVHDQYYETCYRQ